MLRTSVRDLDPREASPVNSLSGLLFELHAINPGDGADKAYPQGN